MSRINAFADEQEPPFGLGRALQLKHGARKVGRKVHQLPPALAQSFVAGFPLRNIAQNADERSSSVRHHFTDRQFHRKHGAVFSQPDGLAIDTDHLPHAGGKIVPDKAVVAFPVRRRHQQAHVVAGQFLNAVAENRLRGVIGAFDNAVFIDRDNGVDDIVEQRSQAQFPVAQMALRVLQFAVHLLQRVECAALLHVGAQSAQKEDHPHQQDGYLDGGAAQRGRDVAEAIAGRNVESGAQTGEVFPNPVEGRMGLREIGGEPPGPVSDQNGRDDAVPNPLVRTPAGGKRTQGLARFVVQPRSRETAAESGDRLVRGAGLIDVGKLLVRIVRGQRVDDGAAALLNLKGQFTGGLHPADIHLVELADTLHAGAGLQRHEDPGRDHGDSPRDQQPGKSVRSALAGLTHCSWTRCHWSRYPFSPGSLPSIRRIFTCAELAVAAAASTIEIAPGTFHTKWIAVESEFRTLMLGGCFP